MQKYTEKERKMLAEMGISFENGGNSDILKKEFQTKKFRRICRDIMINLLKILSACKTKEQFDTFYAKFAEEYKYWFISQNPKDSSVFSRFRNDANRDYVDKAYKVIEKFSK